MRIRRSLLVGSVALTAALSCAKQEAGSSRSASPGMPAPQPIGSSSSPRELETRGAYLATIGGCDDCHTPKRMGAHGPEPDLARRFSGHPATEALPPPPKPTGAWVVAVNEGGTAFAGPWGTSYGANLTSDKDTGIGAWTADDFIRAMRTGKAGGMDLLPPMPWQNVGKLTDSDLRALFAFLQSVPPVKNRVPEPAVAAGHHHSH